MAYFARLDGNNQVVDVITIADADADTEANGIAKARELTNTGSAVWKQTWVESNTGLGIRGNFAGVGGTYMSSVRTLGVASTDVFIGNQLFPSWSVGINTAQWYSPLGGNYESKNIGITSTDAAAGKAYIWCENEYQADTADPNSVGWALTTFSS